MQKIYNQSFTVSHPIKNNNNKLVSSTNEKIKSLAFSLYILRVRFSGHSFSKDF